MKSGMKVIDAHCHIYPEKIVDRAVAGTDHFYGTTAACRGTVSELLAVGDRCGIDGFLVHSVATAPKQVQSINAFIRNSLDVALGLVKRKPRPLPDFFDVEPLSKDAAGELRSVQKDFDAIDAEMWK